MGKSPSSSATTTKWNVLTTPWLEVMDAHAQLQTKSVLDAIRDAGSLLQIVAPNPLDLFAAHRFLLTLLYWQSPSCGGVSELRRKLLAGDVPRTLVEKLAESDGHFWLFDPKKPFLQDPAAKAAKDLPASSLFAEMASGTNVAHFHHADDDASRLCLRCVTLGLLRLVPWTQSGGAGKQPSIHGAPPMMAIAAGNSLASTLGLNLVDMTAPLGKPQWTGAFTPTSAKAGVQILEGLTWNPRRVHLRDAGPPSLCSNCGLANQPVVGPISFEKNPACKDVEDEAVDEWRDPAAFYKAGTNKTVKSSREADASAGDDLRRLFEQKFGKKLEPAPVSAVVQANADHRQWLVVVPCTNPANNKSFDHRTEFVGGFSGQAPSRHVSWDKDTLSRLDDPRTLRRPACGRASSGMRRFVAAAAGLDYGSWNVIANAAQKGLAVDPAAFDVFTGIYWPLRTKDPSAPSRNAAWVALKLMASAGDQRPVRGRLSGAFRPWEHLELAASPAKKKRYPRAVPDAGRLEAELRGIIRAAAIKTPSVRVDWAGLCQFLHEHIS